jgi:O-acetylhomoserine/O-acetylserine sulfhydrylase-like pyridoxal-dependent enzyme
MALTSIMGPGKNFVSTSWLYGGTYEAISKAFVPN